jgi:hypothetical protein
MHISLRVPYGKKSSPSPAMSMSDRCPKKHRGPLTKAPASLWSTQSSAALNVAWSEQNDSSPVATRVERKVFSASRENYTHCKKTTLWQLAVETWRECEHRARITLLKTSRKKMARGMQMQTFAKI